VSHRRQFLIQTCKAAGAAATCAGAGWWFSKRDQVEDSKTLPVLKDYSVPHAPELPGLAIAKGADPGPLVRSALDALGGMERFVSPGDVVLVKPNAAFDRPPVFGATTHPAVVGAVVRLCKRAGAERVIVTDFPIHSFERCFERSGIGQAVAESGGELWVPSPDDFETIDLEGWVLGPWPVYAKPLSAANKLIGIPTAKDHNLCGASLSMKNWYGFLGEGRNRLHQDIHNAITDLCQAFKGTLVVLDATRLLMRNGPTGGSTSDVQEGNTICCSTDPVAVDAFGAELLGKNDLCDYLALAEERALGISDWRSLSPKEVSL